nr:hypothetical protein [uncultured Ottowia sp.]
MNLAITARKKLFPCGNPVGLLEVPPQTAFAGAAGLGRIRNNPR